MDKKAIKLKWETFKKKLNGARKSVTVLIITAWQLVIQNLDDIKESMPIVQQYFGDHAFQIVSGIFGALLLYVRLFHTKGAVEDKLAKKEGE